MKNYPLSRAVAKVALAKKPTSSMKLFALMMKHSLEYTFDGEKGYYFQSWTGGRAEATRLLGINKIAYERSLKELLLLGLIVKIPMRDSKKFSFYKVDMTDSVIQ